MTRARIPQVEGDRLLLPGAGRIALGSEAWHAWLAADTARSFTYRGARGALTARRERQRNGWYWYGYRRAGGRLRKVYLGRAEDLTLARLEAAAADLAAFAEPAPPPGPRPDPQPWPADLARRLGLLATKLHPPLPRPDLVARPRLLSRLDEGLRRPLVAVVAPAGFGKSTLLAAWLAALARGPGARGGGAGPGRAGAPAAWSWLSLDPADNDPTRFWTYLFAAINQLAPGAADEALALTHTPSPPPPPAILSPLLNSLAAVDRDLVLALDDYHVIERQSIHDGVAFLVDHLPPRLHLAVASRTDPPLPLARLRARGQLAELRAADLRFTAAEAAAFLNDSLALGLAGEQVAALEARTEGWAAGIQLAGIAVRDRADPAGFIASFTGSHRAVTDYLVEEVLRRQPEELQQFLLATSVLDRMCAELCDALLLDEGGAADLGAGGPDASRMPHPASRILEEVERLGLFLIPLDDERRWYRYHHLFAEMLRERLRRAAPGRVAELHRRAGAWFAGAGLIAEAIGHALAARDYDSAAEMIEREAASTAWILNQIHTLLGWLDAFPPAFLHARPRLLVARAWAQLTSVQLDAVEATLRLVEALIERQPAAEDTVRGAVLAIRSFLVRLNGDSTQAIDLAQRALTLVPREHSHLRRMVAINLENAYVIAGNMAEAGRVLDQMVSELPDDETGLATLTEILSRAELARAQGRLHEARALAEQCLRRAEARGQSQVASTGMIYASLAELHYEWADLEEAERCARRAVELGSGWWNNDILLNAYSVLASIAHARGDAAGTADLQARVERVIQAYNVAWVQQQAQAFRARHALRDGRLGDALSWAAASGFGLGDEPPPVRSWEYLLFARVAMASGRAAEALPLLARLEAMAAAGAHTERQILVLNARALAMRAVGDHAGARAAAEQALALGLPGGCVRSFVDEGPELGAILAQIAERAGPRDPVGAYAARLARLVARSDGAGAGPGPSAAASGPQPPALSEALSERELEVLRLLAAGLSNGAIAEALVIAVSTVRTHVKNIYAKLGVRGRVQAASAARALGLLKG